MLINACTVALEKMLFRDLWMHVFALQASVSIADKLKTKVVHSQYTPYWQSLSTFIEIQLMSPFIMGWYARQVYVITTPVQVDVIFETKREAESKCPIEYTVQERFLTSNWFGKPSLVPVDDEYTYQSRVT